MNWSSALSLAVVVGGLAFAAGNVFSDELENRKKPSKDEMRKLMDEAARPAPQHAKLAAQAGNWDADCTMWEPSSDTPTTSKGSLTSSSILGGLWLEQDFKGECDGKAIEGRLLLGYSKEKQRYFGLWVSSMGSTPEIMWGTADAAGEVCTFDGDPISCPVGTFTPRWIVRHADADHVTFEHWAKPEGATDYAKALEIKYTRRK